MNDRAGGGRARGRERDREPVSRRGGPARPALSRDAAIRAALGIAGREGLDAVSMRRVATALSTSASALYVYVDSRADLLAAMFDHVMAPVASAGLPGGDWRERLSALLMTAIGAARGHGGIARVALTAVPDGPNATLIAGRVRDLLAEGGLDQAVIPAALDLLALFVTAAALDRVPAAMPERHEEHLRRLRWEIDVILNGLTHTPNP